MFVNIFSCFMGGQRRRRGLVGRIGRSRWAAEQSLAGFEREVVGGGVEVVILVLLLSTLGGGEALKHDRSNGE